MICVWCDEQVLPGEPTLGVQRMHQECMIRAFAGSAAHQLGDCSCFGGDREDPPGLSLRDAARLAFETFKVLQGNGPTHTGKE